MISYLIALALVGLIVGAIARLAVPGPDPMGIGMTILIGIAGSYIAGILVWAFHGRGGAGFILSVLCAIGLLYAVRRSRGYSRGPVGRGRGPVGRGLPPRRRYW